VAEVVAGHEGGGEDAPEGEVCAGLGKREPVAADFHHVGVVPVIGAGVLGEAVGALRVGDEVVLQIEDLLPSHLPAFLAVVGVVDVAGGAPEVADVGGPFPGLGAAPFADAQDHRASGCVDAVSDALVGVLRVGGAGAAPIVFEVVDAPGRKGAGILELVAPAAGIAAAGERAGARVDAELEAVGMEVIGEGFHAARKLGGIGDEVALRVALFERPGVVDDEVVVAGVAHAIFDHGFGGFADDAFVDVAGEGVPAVPAHGWGGREAGELLGQGDRSQAEEKTEEFFHEVEGW